MAALFVILLVGGCDHSAGEPADASPRTRSAPTYVVEDTLHSGGMKHDLAAAVAPALAGTLAPAAVPERDGGRVLYTAVRGRTPVVRLAVRRGRDRVLDEGAYSIAWKRDGVIAYVKALAPELVDPRRYPGHVVVRDGPDGQPESWTPLPGRYVVAAWAGDALLVYRLRAGPPDLLALRPGGRVRELGRTGLVAVSPDGSHIAVSDFGAQPPRLRVLEVRTARELARLPPAELRWVAHAGSWVGDEIAAATDVGVVVCRFAGGSLTLVETIPLEAADLPRVVEEPQLAGDAIAAWGELESQPGEAVPSSALVDYDRTSRTWRRVATGTSLAPPRPAYNPSRP